MLLPAPESVRSGELPLRLQTTAVITPAELVLETINEDLPIDTLIAMRLRNRPELAEARSEYLDAVVEYNTAQFRLYHALGRPPMELARRQDQ